MKNNNVKNLDLYHFIVEVSILFISLLLPKLWGGNTEQGFILFSIIILFFGDCFYALPKKTRKIAKGIVIFLWNREKNKKEATKK